jgi:hypothetical protein
MNYTNIAIALFLVTTAVGGRANAQAPAAGAQDTDTSATSKRADDLTHRGVAFGMKDRWSDAEPLLREAWDLKHSYDIAGNLGIAEAALNKHRDAAEHLTFALRTFPANGKPEHRQLLEQTLARAKLQVAVVTVRVNKDKADVVVDGKPVGIAPLVDPVFIDPGRRTIEARLAGHEPDTRVIDAKKGDASEITLVLRATAPSSSVRNPDPPPTQPWRPGTAWIATGGVLAAGGLAAGLGLTFASKAKASDADAKLMAVQKAGGTFACSTGNLTSDCAALRSANQNADMLSKISAVGYAVAGVGGAFVLTYLLWPTKKVDHGTLITPMVGPGTGGMIINGTF